MKIDKKYLARYIHDIAIEQIAEEYIKRGYSVHKEQLIGTYRADLVAEKDNEKVVIEVKAGKLSPEKKESITAIANYIRGKEGYKFMIVTAAQPEEKKIEIKGLLDFLTDYFLIELPQKLSDLSTHISLLEVTDVDVNEVFIEDLSINAIGSGVVTVELQYGSQLDRSEDNGFELINSFPFEFDIILEYDSGRKMKVSTIKKLEVDTNSFYE